MAGGTKEKKTARRRGKPVEVWVTDEEKAVITDKARDAGMSRSGYMRALGLNTPIRSVVDLTAMADLAKVNGDLGRVAGLLKLWLAERRGDGALTDFRVFKRPNFIQELGFLGACQRFLGSRHSVRR